MSGDGGATILVVDDVPENVRFLEVCRRLREREERASRSRSTNDELFARVARCSGGDVEVELAGEVTLAGLKRPIAAFNVVAVRAVTLACP